MKFRDVLRLPELNTCQPGIDFADQLGLDNARDAIAALQEPEWVAFLFELVDRPRVLAWHRTIRNQILERLPANFPERPLLVAYIAAPTPANKLVVEAAFRARVGEDFQGHARYPLVDGIFSVFGLRTLDGDSVMLQRAKEQWDWQEFRLAWESRFGT